jgi:hypothetical protein
LRADFSDALNVDHAAFTAAFTALVVVRLYACESAVARAAYAALDAPVKAVIAVPRADSRAFTAAPTQAILVVTLDVVVTAPVVVSASAGTAIPAISPNDASAKILFFTIITVFLYFLLILPLTLYSTTPKTT